jgi:hypothetical protein
MKKYILLLFFIVLAGMAKASLTPQDHDTLFVNLQKLSTGWVQYSVNQCNSIFSKSQYTWQDWTEFFNDYYTSNLFTNDLESYMTYPLFY